MVIKTITCHDVYNSGASLQAYALMKYLKNKNNEVEIIDYKPPYLDKSFKLFKIDNPKYNKNIFIKIIYLIAKFPTRIMQLKRKRRYDEFTKKYLKLTSKKYTSNTELKSDLPLADLYIAGSDQIWNSSFENGKDPAFYLDFVPDNKKKISYAASFATDSINEELVPNIRKMLRRLDGISVREISGLNILKSMGINNGVQVLDPVFLLKRDEWGELCTKRNYNEKYIFVYDFDGSDLIETIAIKLAQKNNYKIYTVFKSSYSDKYVKDISPQNFISYIKEAQYIISNSFHATAFSIIFNKEFFVVNRKEKINTRMRDLLSLLGIEKRLVNENTKELDSIKINYSKVEERLNKQIILSQKYLDKVLNNKN